jgi:hypothetical protein
LELDRTANIDCDSIMGLRNPTSISLLPHMNCKPALHKGVVTALQTKTVPRINSQWLAEPAPRAVPQRFRAAFLRALLDSWTSRQRFPDIP